MSNHILPRQLATGLTALAAVLLTSCSGVNAAPQPLQAPATPVGAGAASTAAAGATAGVVSEAGATDSVAPTGTTTGAASFDTSPVATPSMMSAATSEATIALEVAATAVPATAATPVPTTAEISAPAATAAVAAVRTSAPTTAAASAAAAPAPTTAAAPTAAATATAPAAAQAQPVCTPGALTPSLTEGPYYKANPPQTASLYKPGMAGTKLTITGYVLNASCRPIPGARVDFWQADSAGQYDNSGYTLRGYQLTDAQGRYQVVTVVPGLYPGRTEHIHVKVTPPNGSTLTTQLFFPGVAQNNSDGIFAPQNVLKIQKGVDGEMATFDFVVQS